MSHIQGKSRQSEGKLKALLIVGLLLFATFLGIGWLTVFPSAPARLFGVQTQGIVQQVSACTAKDSAGDVTPIIQFTDRQGRRYQVTDNVCGEYAGLAIAYLWRAVELSANRAQSIQCRTALGAAYRARKDPLSLERAAAQYELVLQHSPGHLQAMTGLAAVLRDLGELSQAKALYERVLAVAPQDAHALNGLAGVLHDLGDEQGAQQRFQQSRKLQSMRHPLS